MHMFRRREIFALTILLGAAGLIAANPATTTSTKTKPPVWQMDADGINQIRQSLLTSGDQMVELRFEHNVLRRFATATSQPWDDFNEQPHIQQAKEILRFQDPDFRRDVRVLSDPPVMAEFKAQVLPMIVKGCGSNGCHGSPDVGGFYLSYRLGNVPEVYADFDELRRYVKTIQNNKHSLFAEPIRQWMIDPDDPEQSLLVQYALPAGVATLPHPHVKNWRPMVMDKSEARYRALTRWIGELRQP